MIIQLAIFLVLAGLAVGSFLNVCIDRLPPKRLFYMTDEKGNRLEIAVSNKVYDEDLEETVKDKDVFIQGKITKNPTTGNLQTRVPEDAKIVLDKEYITSDKILSIEEAKNETGDITCVAGRITESKSIKQSLVSPPSHCDGCGRRLTILDNIPIFSYLFLKGKCRTCGVHIPLRVLLVEILTGALFLVAYWRLGFTEQLAVTLLFSCIFIVVIFIDWEHHLILNAVTYPAAVIAAVLLAVNAFVPDANLYGDRTFLPYNSLYSGLISGGILLIFFILIIFITRGSMGMGDAKLVAVIGLVSGFPLMIFSMLIGIVIGGVVAIVLLVTRKKKRKDIIPYGTFLAMGPIIAMLLPGGVMDWYLSSGHR